MLDNHPDRVTIKGSVELRLCRARPCDPNGAILWHHIITKVDQTKSTINGALIKEDV